MKTALMICEAKFMKVVMYARSGRLTRTCVIKSLTVSCFRIVISVLYYAHLCLKSTVIIKLR
jgi:hypothetical protein